VRHLASADSLTTVCGGATALSVTASAANPGNATIFLFMGAL